MFFPSLAEITTEADLAHGRIEEREHERKLTDPEGSLNGRAKSYLRRFYKCEPGLIKPERIQDDALRSRVYALWPTIAEEQGVDMLTRCKTRLDKLAAKLGWPKNWRTKDTPWGR